MTTQTVTADGLISATVKYSNKDDDSRIYDIYANVNIQEGKINSFDAGYVGRIAKDDNEGDMSYIAQFSSYGTHMFTLHVNNASKEEYAEILEAILVFMDNVKSKLSANPITA